VNVGINFPNAPTTGQLYPSPPVAGMPVYRWDGAKWTTVGANSVYVYVADAPPSAPDSSLWWESDSGVLYVRYNDGDSSQWVAVTPVSNPPAPVLDNDVGRNLIHNPLFNIQQRGAGPWTTQQTYTADRWLMFVANDTMTSSIVALTDADRAQIGDEAATSALQAVFAGTSGTGFYSILAQRMEGVRRLAGKTVTISFYARASVGTPKIGIGGWQSFGTGGTPSGSVQISGVATANLSSTWARYSVTVTFPSSAGKTLGTNSNDYSEVDLNLSAGISTSVSGNIGVQSGTVQFWGVQLEVGSAATQLEKPDPAQDLAKCQRFYEISPYNIFSGNIVSGGTYYLSLRFRTLKRATPALSLTPSGGADQGFPAGAPGQQSVSADGLTASKVCNASNSNGYFQFSFIASADL
jgi:hypothetical protein